MRTLVTTPTALVALMIFLVSPTFAQGFLILDASFNIGPMAVQSHITRPVQRPTGEFVSTIHMQVRDDTQTPAFHGSLAGMGSAPDADTLLGGLLPAVAIVKQDLLGGMAFADAVADAQAKTGVTVTSLEDATMVEYIIDVVAVIALAASQGFRSKSASPLVRDRLTTIQHVLTAGYLAAGGSDVCVAGVPVLTP